MATSVVRPEISATKQERCKMPHSITSSTVDSGQVELTVVAHTSTH